MFNCRHIPFFSSASLLLLSLFSESESRVRSSGRLHPERQLRTWTDFPFRFRFLGAVERDFAFRTEAWSGRRRRSGRTPWHDGFVFLGGIFSRRSFRGFPSATVRRRGNKPSQRKPNPIPPVAGTPPTVFSFGRVEKSKGKKRAHVLTGCGRLGSTRLR